LFPETVVLRHGGPYKLWHSPIDASEMCAAIACTIRATSMTVEGNLSCILRLDVSTAIQDRVKAINDHRRRADDLNRERHPGFGAVSRLSGRDYGS